MSQDTRALAARSNRRASRRLAPRTQLRIECRKGTVGLGQNIAVRVLDLSETGVRLVVKTALDNVKEVEVILTGTSYMPPIKRIARVVWTVPIDDGHQAVGLNFSPPLDYARFIAMGSAIKVAP